MSPKMITSELSLSSSDAAPNPLLESEPFVLLSGDRGPLMARSSWND